MYKPAAFLISSAALTSIFSFFFGGYFRERERAYRLWLMFVAYGKELPSEKERIDICSELESRDRMFYQAKGLLGILLLTIGLAYLVFQIYSFRYIFPSSPLYQPGAFTDYIWFNTIIGFIVMINCLELLYIRVAVDRTEKFPFFKIRQRVTGQNRLSKIWMILGCSKLKTPEYSQNKIPRSFYDNQEYYSKEKDRV
ncbi:MAG: hypothetical protein JRF62_13510 [Deltaproteobacteria bacterium]|nr:hypothetical protein [Deltaproteobacteria bacterium]MBW2640650.1 hypothetical protein [Deltaproteobacteria bacterium]